jgi:hypothetical protein
MMSSSGEALFAVLVPVKAGTQFMGWIPAFAGITLPRPLPKNSHIAQPLPLKRQGPRLNPSDGHSFLSFVELC